jgi:hypothetical protein
MNNNLNLNMNLISLLKLSFDAGNYSKLTETLEFVCQNLCSGNILEKEGFVFF